MELHRCNLFTFSFASRSAFYCGLVFIIVQALLQPMCLAVKDKLTSAGPVHTGATSDATWVYGNSRGLRQGCGDFRKTVATKRPTFFGVNESHLKGDPVKPLIPWGYKVLCRLDRTKNGGGLLIGCKKQVLADTLNLHKYNTVGSRRAELIGIDWGGVHWILYYTPNSHEAVWLIDVLQQYKEDHPLQPVVFLGDMNVHNEEWLHSVSGTDHAGVLAQEFSEMFNMHQLVDFPTRGQNTLDLVLSDIVGSALPTAGFGTSDHKSMYLSFTLEEVVPKAPINCAVRDWYHAPWPHIRGALKRAFKDWRPSGTVEEAEDEMDTRITGIIDKYVKFKQPAKPGPNARKKMRETHTGGGTANARKHTSGNQCVS